MLHIKSVPDFESLLPHDSPAAGSSAVIVLQVLPAIRKGGRLQAPSGSPTRSQSASTVADDSQDRPWPSILASCLPGCVPNGKARRSSCVAHQLTPDPGGAATNNNKPITTAGTVENGEDVSLVWCSCEPQLRDNAEGCSSAYPASFLAGASAGPQPAHRRPSGTDDVQHGSMALGHSCQALLQMLRACMAAGAPGAPSPAPCHHASGEWLPAPGAASAPGSLPADMAQLRDAMLQVAQASREQRAASRSCVVPLPVPRKPPSASSRAHGAAPHRAGASEAMHTPTVPVLALVELEACILSADALVQHGSRRGGTQAARAPQRSSRAPGMPGVVARLSLLPYQAAPYLGAAGPTMSPPVQDRGAFLRSSERESADPNRLPLFARQSAGMASAAAAMASAAFTTAACEAHKTTEARADGAATNTGAACSTFIAAATPAASGRAACALDADAATAGFGFLADVLEDEPSAITVLELSRQVQCA